ncbi:glycosyltransferase family 4 protein [Geothrix paludis]|uniref:glycosyltransferase family 4 protein n=1 Tax=Geothrix paludis TaxID=2922722 RepID=UPI001FAC51D8|nr:glycosyltransferase family 4 protein [Geothrix paludis]
MNTTPIPRSSWRICFVTTLYVTLDTFVRQQAETLVKAGWEVTWVSAPRTGNQPAPPAGVRHVPLPIVRGSSALGTIRGFLALFRLFRRERFDLVQYSTPNAAFCASLAARLAGQPRRLYAQWGLRYVGFSGLTRSFFKAVERFVCACSTLVQPDSASNLAFAIDEGLYPPSKGRVIGHGSACGVNLGRFDADQRESWRAVHRQEAGLDEGHVVIGFVGAVCRDKGCNELLFAAQQLLSDHPEARLMLVGPCDFLKTLDPALLAWAQASNQVIWVPPTRWVPEYLACMDVFAFPSYREGFGMAVVEAEAMGLPVVVTDIPGPLDAMVDGITGLVVPVKDGPALASALRRLLVDPSLRARLGAGGRELVAKRFEQTWFMEQVRADKARMVQEGALHA